MAIRWRFANLLLLTILVWGYSLKGQATVLDTPSIANRHLLDLASTTKHQNSLPVQILVDKQTSPNGRWTQQPTVLNSRYLAVDQALRAIQKSSSPRKQENPADVIFQRGISAFQAGQLQEALSEWQLALKVYRTIDEAEGEAAVLGMLGVAHYSLGDYQKAIAAFTQSAEIAREIGNHLREIASLNGLGAVYYKLEDYPKLIAVNEAILRVSRAISDRSAEAIALDSLGNAYDILGNYPKAIDFHEQSLAIAQEIGNRQGEAASLGNLGLTYLHMGDYPQAITLQEQSLAIARAMSDRQREAYALANLGNVYYSTGDYVQALAFHKQSSVVFSEISDRQSEVNALGSLGLVSEALGDYPMALSFYAQSLEHFREMGNRQGEAHSLGNLGNVYNRLGDYPRAINLHRQALAIADEINDRQGQAAAAGNLGNAYANTGDSAQAITAHEQQLTISSDIGDRQGEANALSNLGSLYARQSDYQRALDFHTRALTLSREIGDLLGEAVSLGNLGIDYVGLEDYAQAIDFHQQALAIYRKMTSVQGSASALANLGLAYLNQGNAGTAEDVLFESASMLDSLRSSDLSDRDRINFFETQVQVYEGLELALVLQDKVQSALEVSERGRARSFAQLIAGKISATNETKLRVEMLSLDEIKAVAQEQQSVLVEYSLVSTVDGNPLLYIWVVQPTGEVNFRQVPLGSETARLANLVEQSREAMGAGGRGFRPTVSEASRTKTKALLHELHQILIEPIAELLPRSPEQKVVFVPQDELFLVPFPALMDESGTYLIEQHTMLTAPSIQALQLTRQQAGAQTAPSTELLVVGNPVMPEVWNAKRAVATPLDSLPGAEQEAQAIAALFNTEALIGTTATEAAVKQNIGNARIVHLATHGLLDYGAPEDSGVRDVPGAIALTPGQSEDGLLTAAEIIEKLTLQAELVVLSACDTGLGRVTSEGVIGLSRALMTAGVPSVVVSLWAIPDAPTATLMTDFYSQMKQGKDRAQALRQAMLTTMVSHPEPENWAAFTLIGEAE